MLRPLDLTSFWNKLRCHGKSRNPEQTHNFLPHLMPKVSLWAFKAQHGMNTDKVHVLRRPLLVKSNTSMAQLMWLKGMTQSQVIMNQRSPYGRLKINDKLTAPTVTNAGRSTPAQDQRVCPCRNQALLLAVATPLTSSPLLFPWVLTDFTHGLSGMHLYPINGNLCCDEDPWGMQTQKTSSIREHRRSYKHWKPWFTFYSGFPRVRQTVNSVFTHPEAPHILWRAKKKKAKSRGLALTKCMMVITRTANEIWSVARFLQYFIFPPVFCADSVTIFDQVSPSTRCENKNNLTSDSVLFEGKKKKKKGSREWRHCLVYIDAKWTKRCMLSPCAYMWETECGCRWTENTFQSR